MIRTLNDWDAFYYIDKTLNISQSIDEIMWLMAKIREHTEPHIILEIGCWTGGNLCLLSRLLDDDGIIIGINPIVEHDMDRLDHRLIQNMISPVKFYHIGRKNNDPETLTELLSILQGRPIDVIFTDHTDTYDLAYYDVASYIPYLNTPGVFGFHDVKSYPNGPGLVWEEVSTIYKGEKYISDIEPHGIGVLYK